jgi:hypothetical protein
MSAADQPVSEALSPEETLASSTEEMEPDARVIEPAVDLAVVEVLTGLSEAARLEAIL